MHTGHPVAGFHTGHRMLILNRDCRGDQTYFEEDDLDELDTMVG